MIHVIRFTALKHILYTLLTICDNIDGPLPLRTFPLSLIHGVGISNRLSHAYTVASTTYSYCGASAHFLGRVVGEVLGQLLRMGHY